MAYQSINPYDGKVLQTFEQLGAAQLEEKLQRASACFRNDWSVKSYAGRAAVLARAAAGGWGLPSGLCRSGRAATHPRGRTNSIPFSFTRSGAAGAWARSCWPGSI